MPLSTGDIIALISLVVGLQALVFAVVVYILQMQRKKELEGIKELQRNSFYLKHMASNIVESMINIRTAMEVQNVVLARLIRGVPFNTELILRVSNAFADDWYRVEKALQTLMIFTTDRKKRASAFKQLAERFGDADTLESLDSLAAYETDQIRDLERAIQSIKDRLNKAVINENRPQLIG